MKKCYFLIFLFIFLAIFNLKVNAKNKKYDISLKIVEKEINKEIPDYLASKNKRNLDDLSIEEKIDLGEEVEKIKIKYYKDEVRWFIPGEYEEKIDLSGLVFLTLDSTTLNWNHGHAGIGSGKDGKVIEVNYNDVIREYKNRVKTYWKHRANGGIYKVIGVQDSAYNKAKEYAVSKKGLNYGFEFWDSNTFYCSELVYKAWKSAGYDIATSSILFIYPIHMMNDSDLYRVAKFPWK